jgi:Cof subfamily protein (haloacid dehalogenase superfamily)
VIAIKGFGMSSPLSIVFDPPPHLVEKMLRVRFVVMDVDGTITSPGDRTALNVSQVLGRLDHAGIRWSFATGRSIAGLYQSAIDILGSRPNRILPPAICYNGAVIFVPGTPSILSIRTIPERDARRALDLGRQLGLSALVYTCTSYLGRPREIVYTDQFSADQRHDINGMPIVFAREWSVVDLAGTVAILFEIPEGPSTADLRWMQQMAGPALRITSSGGPFYEVTSFGTSKGEALTRMINEVQVLGVQYETWRKFDAIDLETTMAIGDNLNDVEMLEVAGLAVAVSNSTSEVKNVADLISSLPSGQGVVEVIKMLLDIRRYRTTNAQA